MLRHCIDCGKKLEVKPQDAQSGGGYHCWPCWRKHQSSRMKQAPCVHWWMGKDHNAILECKLCGKVTSVPEFRFKKGIKPTNLPF